jgi:ribosome-binding protein aMBF1 (putative translation factor)
MKKLKEKKTPKGERIEKEFHRRQEDHPDLLTDPSHHRIPESPAKGPSKQTLGSRIHETRQLRGLTLQDLSSRTGIGLETLEKVEANKIIPPLGELIKLGKALEMKMGYFISGAKPRPWSTR